MCPYTFLHSLEILLVWFVASMSSLKIIVTLVYEVTAKNLDIVCVFLIYFLRISYLYTMYFNHINIQLLPDLLPYLPLNLMSSFHSPPNPVRAILMWMGVGPSTGKWAPSRGLLHWRTLAFLPQQTSTVNTPQLGVGIYEFLSLNDGTLVPLILCRSCVSNSQLLWVPESA